MQGMLTAAQQPPGQAGKPRAPGQGGEDDEDARDGLTDDE